MTARTAGRLAWSLCAGCVVVGVGGVVVLQVLNGTAGLGSAPLPGLAPMPNPVMYLPEAKPLFQLFRNLAAVCSLAGVAGAIAALVVRFRRSRGIERQQLKWFTYAAALTPFPFLAHDFAPSISGLLLALILPLVPISIGVAIAAGSLVFVLVAGPGADPPSWLVAAATLAAAAIFRPARRRIQAAVDRRFNRRRYNAAQTMQAFSTRLRDQVDLDTLSTELLAVVDQTMQPTRVSVSLRPSPPGSSGTTRSEARPTTWAC